MAPENLKMEFKPADLRKGEQDAIGVACRKFQIAHSDLHSSTLATVNSAPGKTGRIWWHSNDNDKTEHVTVRYNRRIGGNRVHVYRDGSGKMNPDKPPKNMKRSAEADQEEELYDSDCTVEWIEGEEEEAEEANE